jgi:hypothetical protein
MNGILILYILFMAAIFISAPLLHVHLFHRNEKFVWPDETTNNDDDYYDGMTPSGY